MNWPAHGLATSSPAKARPKAEKAERLAVGDACWLAPTIQELLIAWRFGLPRLATEAVIGVGIDPGIKGAIGLVLRLAGVVRGASVFPLPVMADPTKTGRVNRKAIDCAELWRWLRLLGGEATGGATVRVAVEKHLIMPGRKGAAHHGEDDGAAAGFNYSTARSALTAGKISGLLGALAVERSVILLVDQNPTTWRSALKLAGGDKQYLLERARAVYPQVAARLTAKSHHDRGEALLLATYALDAPC